MIQLCDGMRPSIRHDVASCSLCGYCGAVEAVTLSDLGPIIAAVLGPMLLFVAASMRYQHVDSTKTRELITKSIEKANKENRKLIDRNRDLIEKSNKDTRDLIGKSNKDTRDLIDKNHAELSSSLSDARERLARIEGHLRISPSTEQGTADGGDNAKAA